ncbi:pilus assembly FimT family protein [Rheinheimera texasensis]|uniref:pilus assembly FimT family protein n=1 Tax=Rheinheimera texasensis TaxID=306205 RepID=UPI00068EC1CD|nr:type II secretion system protein [Rheinheimera texasensis]
MRKHWSGFTLIELLVVLSLMSAVVALVGPLGFAQVEKIKAKSEWYQLTQQMESLRKHAFLRGSDIVVGFEGKAAEIRYASGQVQNLDFNYVFFLPQNLYIDSHGEVEQTTISALVLQVPQEYNFK